LNRRLSPLLLGCPLATLQSRTLLDSRALLHLVVLKRHHLL